MKTKLLLFVSSFILYATIFLAWNNWHLTTRETAEMVFIGTLLSAVSALAMNRMRSVITRIVERVVIK